MPHSSRRHVLHPENYVGHDPSFPECAERKKQVVSARGCTNSAATDCLLRQLAPTLAAIFCRILNPLHKLLNQSKHQSIHSVTMVISAYIQEQEKEKEGVSSGTVNSRYDFLRVLCESFISDTFWLSGCSSVFD